MAVRLFLFQISSRQQILDPSGLITRYLLCPQLQGIKHSHWAKMLPPAEFSQNPSTPVADSRNPNVFPCFLAVADTIPLPVKKLHSKRRHMCDRVSKMKEHNSGTLHMDVRDVPQETQTWKGEIIRKWWRCPEELKRTYVWLYSSEHREAVSAKGGRKNKRQETEVLCAWVGDLESYP